MVESSDAAGAAAVAVPADVEQRLALDRMLSGMRWIAIAAMLVITLAWPIASRTGHPLWPFVAVLGGYNLFVELLRHRVARLRSFAWVPYADLPVAGALYYLDAEPGGPLFISFFVAVVTAATGMSLRGVVLYTAAVVAVVVAVAPTLPLWASTDVQVRTIAARLCVLALVAVGTAVLSRRLVRQGTEKRAALGEAERLAALDRLRSAFFASISHDLRTPLTAARAALGMAIMSADDRLRADERQLLANARRNVERLHWLIDDLLAFNQLEAGTLRLNRRLLDLRTVVETAATTMAPLLQEKEQHLRLELPEPLVTPGDAQRLEQVLLNLLGNAHAHTQSGANITVVGWTTPEEVRLVVTDDGPGIPAEDLETVFQRFHRHAVSGGSGLGLASARALVELHDGRLWAERPAGSGATFHLALPRPPDPAPVGRG